MKISVNDPCPCGSKMKYKRCCQKYHQGAEPKDALVLMKSRYVAYVVGDAKYIIKTTHPQNPDYHDNFVAWEKSIEVFSQQSDFLRLEIEEFTEELDCAYVTFKAILIDSILHERSKFTQIGKRWYYLDAVFK